jgi:hypothetical protein
VNCGERWGTGTLFGDSQHVVTSFALINRGRSAKAPALAAAETPPSAGDAFLMPYHPRDTTLDPKNPGEAQVPLPVFGRVGRTGKTQLDLDARNIDQPGLSGAPVLSANGTLLGFLDAERSWEQRRVIATRVERAERLFAEREKAGEFSPDTHTSWFAGLFGVLGPEQSMGLRVAPARFRGSGALLRISADRGATLQKAREERVGPPGRRAHRVSKGRGVFGRSGTFHHARLDSSARS